MECLVTWPEGHLYRVLWPAPQVLHLHSPRGQEAVSCLEAWVSLCGVTLNSLPRSLGLSFPICKWGFGAVLSSLSVTGPQSSHI